MEPISASACGLHYGDGEEAMLFSILFIQRCIIGFQSLICVSVPPSALVLSVQLESSQLIPLLSPPSARMPSNYLTTALKQTNICLAVSPDPAFAFPP